MSRRSVGALLIVGSVLVLAACGSGGSATTSTSTTSGPPLASGTLAYCTAGGVALTMDVFPQTATGSTPAPVAMMVHGGGWEMGNAGPPGLPNQVERMLQARGFFVASINYRLAPDFRWPAQLEDTKCAVRYLRAHASRLGIDPHRIGAWGDSAGGHLVAMLGTTGRSAGYDVGQYLDQPSAVEAVVDEWGPADLTAPGWGPAATGAVTTVFGASPGRTSPSLVHASPVTFVRAGDPPFLIIQGLEDTTVPASQSQELYQRLLAAGVPATLVMVQNAEHGLAPTGTGPVTPPVAQVHQMLVDFFVRQLQR